MNTAARLYSLFMLLIFVGSFIAGISDSARFGAAGVFGAFLVPVIFGVPTVSALMAIGRGKPRVTAFSLMANKIYLFILVAAFVGFGLKITTNPSPLFLAFLVPGVIVAVCFVLNIVALQRQRRSNLADA